MCNQGQMTHENALMEAVIRLSDSIALYMIPHAPSMSDGNGNHITGHDLLLLYVGYCIIDTFFHGQEMGKFECSLIQLEILEKKA